MLTEAQRVALEVLRTAGASALDEDCTVAELRSAYRRLALRWHPDRHGDASSALRSQLAQTFASVADAYRLLALDLHDAA